MANSTDKKKRHREAEKVEKLRLLVSYLRSGSSEPLIKPLALEADELELAQRHKLNQMICEDCLRATEEQQPATGAWSNPQNLATWIDNEVNSLVNDLELVKQQNEKPAKCSKRKWLSSSSHNIRSSSGAL